VQRDFPNEWVGVKIRAHLEVGCSPTLPDKETGVCACVNDAPVSTSVCVFEGGGLRGNWELYFVSANGVLFITDRSNSFLTMETLDG
jgi:hypothetical protein